MEHSVYGVGTYGCTTDFEVDTNKDYTISDIKIYPGFETEDFSKNKVVKILFDDSIIQEEIESNSIIRKLDPNGTFTIYTIAECKITINHPLLLRKCKKESEFLNNPLHAFIMPYGGTVLQETDSRYMNPQFINELKQTLTIQSLIQVVMKLMQGLSLLAKHKLVHRDIKLSNILYDSLHHKFNLIDFGISCKGDKTYGSTELAFLSFSYPIFPPEFTLIAILYISIMYRTFFTTKYMPVFMEDYSKHNDYEKSNLYRERAFREELDITDIIHYLEKLKNDTNEIREILEYNRKYITVKKNVTMDETYRFKQTIGALIQNIETVLNDSKLSGDNPEIIIWLAMNLQKKWKYVDIYSIGIVLSELLNVFEKENLMSSTVGGYTELKQIIQKMTEVNIDNTNKHVRCRLTPEEAIQELETLKTMVESQQTTVQVPIITTRKTGLPPLAPRYNLRSHKGGNDNIPSVDSLMEIPPNLSTKVKQMMKEGDIRKFVKHVE